MSVIFEVPEGVQVIRGEGIVVSCEIFKWFADSANVGRKFRFVKSGPNDVVTIETLYE